MAATSKRRRLTQNFVLHLQYLISFFLLQNCLYYPLWSQKCQITMKYIFLQNVGIATNTSIAIFLEFIFGESNKRMTFYWTLKEGGGGGHHWKLYIIHLGKGLYKQSLHVRSGYCTLRTFLNSAWCSYRWVRL